jgi:hypothetical protein
MTRALVLAITLALGACAPSVALSPQHPARADAASGRLAGPPAALRAGVADDVPAPAPAAEPAPAHEHHH